MQNSAFSKGEMPSDGRRRTLERLTESIPGFDYTSRAGATIQLELLHEQLNTDIRGEVAGFECRVVATDYVYRISALGGDPIYQYAGVIDRPPPLEVGIRDTTVIVINGLADPTAPTVAAARLYRNPPPKMPSFEKIHPPRTDPIRPMSRFPMQPNPDPRLTSPAIHPASSPTIIHPRSDWLIVTP